MKKPEGPIVYRAENGANVWQPRWLIALAVVGAILILWGVCTSHAAPPAGVDPNGPVAKWVSNWANSNNQGCCGIHTDCRPTRILPNSDSPSGYDAWIDKITYGDTAPNDWVHIPVKAFSEHDAVRKFNDTHTASDDNPTGSGWACWYSGEVRCASRSNGG